MNPISATSTTSMRRARLTVAATLLALLSGCVTYPEMKRKTLQQLYHEAITTAQHLPAPASVVREPQIQKHKLNALPPAREYMPQEGPPVAAPPAHTITVPLLPAGQTHRNMKRRSGWQSAARQKRVSGATTQIQRVSHTSDGPALVTEFLEDSDVRQAVHAIASQAKVNVIIDEQVGGVVSAIIEEEPFERALRKILMPLGYVYKKVSETEYLVGVAEPSSPLFSRLSERLEFRPLHLSPEELVSLVPEREQKFVQAVEARNRILIEAPPEIAAGVVDRLKQFDSPIPQVELEAIVCVISPDHEFKSGLDWGHAVSLNGAEVMNLGFAGLAFNGAASGTGLSNSFSNFAVTSAFVKLLAQEGYLSIRAAPRVTARDGDQAKISITRESFFSTQPQTDNAFFRQDIQQVDAGIELDITPIVRGDNITVKIEKAEVSEDIRTSQINSSIVENPFPQINRRTVSTTVHVQDGETIVIGGLVQRQTVDRIAKVPVLGDVPGLGRLFQTVEQREQDAEVIIFISPKLVKPNCSPACE